MFTASEAASTWVSDVSREEILEQIRRYEAQFGMTSDEFLERWELGTVDDSFETNDWAMLLETLTSGAGNDI